MRRPTLTRRHLLRGASAAGALLVAGPSRAQTVPPAPVTPTLIDAANREGQLGFYTAMEPGIAEKVARGFEQKYPRISVRLERSGSEEIFARIDQEQKSGMSGIDIVSSSDASHFITWKRNGWLVGYLPEEVAKFFPAEQRDPDAMYFTTRVWLSPLGYNTTLVKPEDAPKGFAELATPKWANKLVAGNPTTSGGMLTANFQIARDLGWPYLEKLARQRVLHVPAAADPPRKIASGERAVMVSGADYELLILKDQGKPVEIVYPAEGTPVVVAPTGVFKSAHNPNAARLFQSWLHGRETQQFLVDATSQYSVHAQVNGKPGRAKLADIKLMKPDPAGVEAQRDDIKTRYTKTFRLG